MTTKTVKEKWEDICVAVYQGDSESIEEAEPVYWAGVRAALEYVTNDFSPGVTAEEAGKRLIVMRDEYVQWNDKFMLEKSGVQNGPGR